MFLFFNSAAKRSDYQPRDKIKLLIYCEDFMDQNFVSNFAHYKNWADRLNIWFGALEV